jgi:signal transduction histidine kinase
MEPRLRPLFVVALAAALTLPVCTSAAAQTGSPRVVLTIHLGPETFPSNPVLDAGIREALASRSDVPVNYFAEYLESDLFPGDDASAAFVEYSRQKYQGRKIDVVIASSDPVLRFVLDHRDDLFPKASIVFSGLFIPDEIARGVRVGVTGIQVGVAYAETLKMALDLQPSTDRVFVVATGGDQQTIESVRTELSSFSTRVRITYLEDATVRGLVSAVKAIPPRSIILYIWHNPRPDAGNVVYADAIAQLVAQAATVPVYGTSDFYIGTGVVGGVVRRTNETGIRLGAIAIRILTGTRPQDIPIETAQVVPVVDWREMQRWGIPTSRLPVGSLVLFQEPSVWERYTVYVVGAVTVLLIQAALIGGLLVQRVRRRTAEQQLRRSQSALRTSYERVRDLGSRLLNAQERERSRIARELHDDISQQLAVLKIDLKLLSRTVQGHVEGVAADAVKRAEDIATSVHDLSHRLHPARLRLMGLVEALEGLQSELSQPDVTVTFTHENVPSSLPPDLTLCLFRIAQEALQNALKYSKARNVSVDVRAGFDGITLTIVDDGVGFDVDAMWGSGLGLISVDERVEAIGGTFEIRSGPGAGTRLEVKVPAATLHDGHAVAV